LRFIRFRPDKKLLDFRIIDLENKFDLVTDYAELRKKKKKQSLRLRAGIAEIKILPWQENWGLKEFLISIIS
jgi:hypothetical protein